MINEKKRRGRPPKQPDNLRKHNVAVYLTDAEYWQLSEMARRSGKTMSETIAALLCLEHFPEGAAALRAVLPEAADDVQLQADARHTLRQQLALQLHGKV